MPRNKGAALLVGALLASVPSCDSGSAHPTASDTFDLEALRVSDYRLGKRAAASYTFDDGCPSSFQIADIFESFGLRATFFITPILVGDEDWSRWKELAAHGHEIGNHSQNHLRLGDPALSDEQLAYEIEGAQLVLEQKLGERPLMFAFPFGSLNGRSTSIVLRSHLAARTPGLPLEFAYFPTAVTDDLTAALESALAARQWFVAGGHGIDGDCWAPLPSAVLTAHLGAAAALSADLWVDTFGNVARYRLARRSVRPTLITASKDAIRVRLEGAVDPRLADVRLTIEIPVTRWAAAVRARDASGTEVPIVVTQSAILIEARPMEEIQIDILPE